MAKAGDTKPAKEETMQLKKVMYVQIGDCCMIF